MQYHIFRNRRCARRSHSILADGTDIFKYYDDSKLIKCALHIKYHRPTVTLFGLRAPSTQLYYCSAHFECAVPTLRTHRYCNLWFECWKLSSAQLPLLFCLLA